MRSILTSVKIGGGMLALAGVILLILAPLIGEKVFSSLWALEPFTYIGGALIISGLGTVAVAYAGASQKAGPM
ncbi:MAG: hypothetical protein VX484_06650, partial [Chloroflexota bacterium]|nr:hypothetical protein [Chloroflexota bacterium]